MFEMASGPDDELVARLRRRDAAAFSTLLDRHSPVLLRLTRSVVRDWAVAEDIVQDTWLAVLDGIDGFEGRSSFRTWLCQIALNKARTRAKREQRMVPVAEVHEGPVVDGERFGRDGHWAEPPRAFRESPDVLLERAEIRAAIEAELDRMPESQRLVVTLRDIGGADAEEVCHVLGLSETNQRQLLHRGRARLRAVLEELDRRK